MCNKREEKDTKGTSNTKKVENKLTTLWPKKKNANKQTRVHETHQEQLFNHHRIKFHLTH